MLDMSWGEVMLIGGVALIVIGPKDLPKALRTVGQVTTKLRRMAGEFQMQFNEAIREAELDEVRKEVDGLRSTVRSASGFNPVQTIRDELKGAVEGREGKVEAKAEGGTEAPPVGAPVQGPAKPAFGTEMYGPERLAPDRPVSEPSAFEPSAFEPPASEPRTLADATARLKAERATPIEGEADPASASHDHAAADMPLPVPGSVDDPFGTPHEPASPDHASSAPPAAQNGTAGR